MELDVPMHLSPVCCSLLPPTSKIFLGDGDRDSLHVTKKPPKQSSFISQLNSDDTFIKINLPVEISVKKSRFKCASLVAVLKPIKQVREAQIRNIHITPRRL